MSRFTVLVAVLLFAGLSLGGPLLRSGDATPASADNPHGAPHLYLDVTEPLCTTDDPHPASATISLGDIYHIGICLEGDLVVSSNPVSPANFEADIAFDPLLESGVQQFEPSCRPNAGLLCRDVNPDLNDGAAPDKVGASWACDGFAKRPWIYPDKATIDCNDQSFGGSSTLTNRPGLLATITLTAAGLGTDTMSFLTLPTGLSHVSAIGGPFLLCGTDIQCFGASVQIVTPTATPTFTPTSTATATATLTPTATPTITPTPITVGGIGSFAAPSAAAESAPRPPGPWIVAMLAAIGVAAFGGWRLLARRHRDP